MEDIERNADLEESRRILLGSDDDDDQVGYHALSSNTLP